MRHKAIFSLVSICIIGCLFTPYIIKINHGLLTHEDTICVAKGDLHIHEIEFDCDFYKYQISSLFYIGLVKPKLIQLAASSEKLTNHYVFTSKFQKLHFVLRGPPVLG